MHECKSMIIETEQTYLHSHITITRNTTQPDGAELSISIIHKLKAKVLVFCTLQTTCMFMSRISMHKIFKVAYCLLCLFFPYFPFTQTIFFSKNVEEEKRPYRRRYKSIRTFYFLSLFSLHQIHVFLQKDWGKEGFLLLQAVKQVLPTLSFLSLFSLGLIHLFLKKRLRKKMDVARTHFGAALYRLCVMLCTFGPVIVYLKCALHDTKSTVGSTKILDREMGS